MKKGQVLILYDNPLFADGLASILRREGGLKVESPVGRRGNRRRLIKSLRPDVVIIEGSNPRADASGVLRELWKYNTKARVVSVNLNSKDAVVYIGLQFVATESNLIKAVRSTVPRWFCELDRK
ncbi:MAG: hypothetical protein V3W37_08385 [Candidatus Binatia bacterium]